MGKLYKCLRCGHEWEGRNKTPPKACAKCKTYQWREPKRKEARK